MTAPTSPAHASGGCAHCHRPVHGGLACTTCPARYHPECTRDLWRCAVEGCRGHVPESLPVTGSRSRAATYRWPAAPRRPRDRRRRVGVVLSAGLGAAVAVAAFAPVQSSLLPRHSVMCTEGLASPPTRSSARPDGYPSRVTTGERNVDPVPLELSDRYFNPSHEGVVYYTTYTSFTTSQDVARSEGPCRVVSDAIDYPGWTQPVGK